MPKRVLWIDNDKIFLAPHVLRLEVEGYTVKQVFTLTEGLEEINRNQYDLLIIDVMMPIKEEEEELFPARDTNSGKKAGLVFYNKYKEMCKEKGIAILVFTIREDAAIRDGFLKAGLPGQNLMTKSQGADTAIFLAKVKELLGEKSDT